MFEKYNINCLKLFKEAEKQRVLLHHEYVGTEHLVLAILKQDDELGSIFQKYNINYDDFYQEVKSILSPVRRKITNNIYTPLLKKVIYEASKDEIIDSNSLFFHILDEGEGVAIRILLSMGIDIDDLYHSLKNRIIPNEDLQIYKMGKLLNESVDLNEKVIGRDKEINLIMETLLRKKKNNPLLVGDAGVGKSAIVEELARRIVKGQVPEALLNTKIVNLEMGTLVAGTKYRGEFEEKITKIISEILPHKQIILFIDEIHTLSSAGSAEGAISAADILKPYLARGEIKCIGATTKEEYEKYFAKDKALSRRFETILVKEPTEEETINILRNIKEEYTNYHKINIKDDLLSSLVHLTNIYFPNKYNPDKSIELLDSVMSYVKLKTNNTLIKQKEDELQKIEILKIKEIENGHFKEALQNNIQENKLKKEINNLRNAKRVSVTSEDIMDVLEFKNHIIKNKRISLSEWHYDKKFINIINHSLKGIGLKSFYLVNAPSDFGKNLAKMLNYQFIKVNSEKSIDKMYKTIKYYPSTIIMIDESASFSIQELVKKIYCDHLVEYNDEYLNFNHAIILINAVNHKVGFNAQKNAPFYYDEMLEFTDTH